MAKLHFHYGTMGSAKSAIAIMTAYNQNAVGNKTEIIKPQIDIRSATDKIQSRIGISAPAITLKNLQGYTPSPDTKMLLVDEVQFFSPTDIDTLVQIADNTPTIVMCYGLMVDSNEQMFPAAKRLFEVGAKLHHIETSCQINGCPNKATHHLRFDDHSQVIRQGDQIAVGDSIYKSVCRQHFNQFYHGYSTKQK